MASMPTTGAPTTETSANKRVISTKMVTIGVILAAAIWFILVNTGKARVRLWIPTVSAPMWVVLLVTFAGGMVVGLLIRRSNRAKSQKRAAE
jgi:uncharacterized integral membrane protein